MAEQAGDLIKDALIEITALGAEASIEAVDAQAAARYLNRMMLALDADGITLGFTEISSLSDVVTIPAGANEGVVDLLAYKLFNQFAEDGAPIPQTLFERKRESMKLLAKIGVNIGATEYPANLPIGSGNQNYGTDTSRFYDELQDTILAETNGSISLEDDTV